MKYIVDKFIIRDIENQPNKYEILKYQFSGSGMFTIGYLIYNPKEQWCELQSVGLRYIEYRDEILDLMIKQFNEILISINTREGA